MNQKKSLGLLALAMLALLAMTPSSAAANVAVEVSGDDATVGVATAYGTAEVDADTDVLPTGAMGGSATREAVKICVYDTVTYCGEDGYLWATAEGPWGCISTWLVNPTKGCKPDA